MGATFLAADPVHHDRTRHVDLDYHFVHERIAARNLLVRYVAMHQQFSSILMKNLASTHLEEQHTDLTLRFRA